MAPGLENKEADFKLKTNANKFKVLNLIVHRTHSIYANGQNIEGVQ